MKKVPSACTREVPDSTVVRLITTLSLSMATALTSLPRGNSSDSAPAYGCRQYAVRVLSEPSKMTFSRPGTYVVRAYGDDGMLPVPLDVTVTVQP